jgi:hypothetical protein
MNMQPVTSGNIEAVGYDPLNQKMIVRFKGGSEYEYNDVPNDAHTEFITAPSVGSHYHKAIKGKYTATKLGEEKKEQPQDPNDLSALVPAE